MGTLPEVPAPGLICLKEDVSDEFDKHLAKTEHSSADQFLEHLFDLFSKSKENARSLQIRADLAQRFLAVVQGGQFQNSNDLMTYLLQLNTQHAESNLSLPSVPVKQVQDKLNTSSMGRKSRKSQPKRNVKHQVLLESPNENGSSHSVENTVESEWREGSVSSEEKDSSVVGEGEASAPFDLSVVKQEVMDEEDQTRETTSKDSTTRKAKRTKRKGKRWGRRTRTRRPTDTETIYVDALSGTVEESHSETDESSSPEEYPTEQYQDSAEVLEAPEIEIDEDVAPEDDIELEEQDNSEPDDSDARVQTAAAESSGANKAVYSYICKYCKKKCRSRGALNMHIYSVHGVSTKNRLLCTHCFKQFVFQHEFDIHTKFVCKRISRQFSCKKCKVKFHTQNERDNHPCSKDQERPFFCDTKDCQYVCKSVKALRDHAIRHLGIKPYLCNTCGHAFSMKKDMDRHAEKHKDVQDNVCKHCGKAYKRKHSLQKHMLQHTKKGKHKCKYCSYTTPYHYDLNQHMLRHMTKQHKCDLCNKSLRSASSLAKHMENVHSSNKIFVCQYCDFTTTAGKVYSGHMLKHRNEKESIDFYSDEEMLSAELVDQSTLNTSTTEATASSTGTDTQPLYPLHVQVLPEPGAHQIPASFHLQPGSCLQSPPPLTQLPTLTEATLAGAEEVEFTGQNADTLMSNIVASSYGDITISQDASVPNLSFYVSDISGSDSMVTGVSTMSMPGLMMPDTISSIADNDTWGPTDQN